MASSSFFRSQSHAVSPHDRTSREAMLAATHTDHAPWTLVDFNDQKRGRLTLIRDLLDRLPDTHIEPPAIDFPDLAHEPHAESYDVIEPLEPFAGKS